MLATKKNQSQIRVFLVLFLPSVSVFFPVVAPVGSLTNPWHSLGSAIPHFILRYKRIWSDVVSVSLVILVCLCLSGWPEFI